MVTFVVEHWVKAGQEAEGGTRQFVDEETRHFDEMTAGLFDVIDKVTL